MGLWETLALDMERHRMVTFVGGGGKTTSIFAMAREARQAGKTVLVTTTTHMLPHPSLFLAGAGEGERLGELLAEYGLVTVGTLTPQGKLTGAEDLAACKRAADIVLVEGDGARLHPLKVPAGHEPVIPPESDAVAALCGLDCLGEPIGAVCHRPELVGALLGKGREAPVEPRDVAEILLSTRGGRKNVGSLPYVCILNKADNETRRAQAKTIGALLEEEGVKSAVTAYTEEERGGLLWF